MTASQFSVWDRHIGVLYLIRGYHPLTGRVIRAYAGKTIQRPWTKRIDQHLWGRGRYNNPQQPWADTVVGWRPNGTVQEVIAAGGVRVVWEGRCSPFGLWWREILMIWLLRPKYNYQWNRANNSRITMTKAKTQRALRDRVGVSYPALASELRVLHRWVAVAAVSLVCGVLLIPGVPTTVTDTARWGWHNPLQLLILGVAAAMAMRIPRSAIRKQRK